VKEDVDKVTTSSKEAVRVINTLPKESTTETNFLAMGESTEIQDRPVEDADVVSNEAVFPSSAPITGFEAVSPPASVVTSVNPTLPLTAFSPLVHGVNPATPSSTVSPGMLSPPTAGSSQAWEVENHRPPGNSTQVQQGTTQRPPESGVSLTVPPAETPGVSLVEGPSRTTPVSFKSLSRQPDIPPGTTPTDQTSPEETRAPSLPRLRTETECLADQLSRKRKGEMETASSVLRKKGRLGAESLHSNCNKLKPMGSLRQVSKRTVPTVDMIDDVVEGVRELVGSARADRYWVLSEASSAAIAVTFVQDSNIPQIQRLAELKPFK